MRRAFLRLLNLLRRNRAELEMTRELVSHLALIQEDLERRGFSPADAAREARRSWGGLEQTRERHREARSFIWLEQLLKDIRSASRHLLRNPGYTLVAALAIALGIGANATIFGIYNAVALKQLPIADPGRVVRVQRWSRWINRETFAYTEYQFLRDRSTVFSGLTAASGSIPALASLPGETDREHLTGHAVSANYFADLGVNARIGRTFQPDEDRVPGLNPIVVLSYRLWQRKFHADPLAIGQTIALNGRAFTIVGVAPASFPGTDLAATDFWTPLSMIEDLVPDFGPGWRAQWRDTDHPGFEILGRLKADVSRNKAQLETDVLMRGYLAGQHEQDPTIAVTLQRTSWFTGADSPWFRWLTTVVFVIVSMVLLVACANVANMVLARGVARRREIGIRMALGSGRARVVRQLLTESILLSLLGGAAGVLLSLWLSRLLWLAVMDFVPNFRGFDLDMSPDVHVLIYGLALSTITGIVFGLVPALRITRPDLYTATSEDGALSGSRLGQSRLRGVLLGTQAAVSVLLLVVSGGLIGGLASSFVKAADLGFEADKVLFVTDTNQTYRDKLPRIQEQLERLPQLSSVAMGAAPLRGLMALPVTAGKWSGQSFLSLASDGYFDTLGIRLVRGRAFTRREADARALLAVVSESTARRAWPGEDPLGKHFTASFDARTVRVAATSYEVIGVARDVRFHALSRMDDGHIYLPTSALKPRGGVLLLRTRSTPGKALGAIQSAVESVDPALLPGLNVMSLEDGSIAVQRVFLRVLAGFAGTLSILSLTLASIGIYGVAAFLVTQRTREIGLRMALGATTGDVLRNILAPGLRPVLLGTLTGLAAAGLVVSVLRTSTVVLDDLSLFTHTFTDPVLYGELLLVIIAIAIAIAVPAKRAARVDPMTALRHE